MEIDEMKQTTISLEGDVLKIYQGYSHFYVPVWALTYFMEQLAAATEKEPS
jgi:hypothetical protein